MKFAAYLPTTKEFADALVLAELASLAEEHGWDGCFIWDVLAPSEQVWAGPAVDPWIALGLMASRTERVRLGAMVTPVSRRRPWKLARESVTVDQISRGRLTLGVGLGDGSDQVGEAADPKTRAAMLDEGLDVLAGLWSGRALEYEGAHYRVIAPPFLPRPVQEPRIPIWVGGLWPNRRPLERAARWDGFFPYAAEGVLTPDHCRQIGADLSAIRREEGPFDLIVAGPSSGVPSAESVRAFADAGATWWLQTLNSMDDAHRVIEAGPPQA